MEFVTDEDSQVYTTQVINNITEILTSTANSGNSAFTDENSDLRRDLLSGIALGCENDEMVQTGFGKDIVLQFIVAHLESDNMDFVHAALWAWVRICRRQILDKATVNVETCDLSQGYITQLLAVMKKHIDNREVAFVTCSLIMILASDSSERQQILGKEGAPALVVEVLQKFREFSEVMEMACRDVRNLSADDDVANMLVQEGVGEQLHEILQDRENQPLEVIEAVIYAIINLSYDNNIALILGSIGLCVSIVDLLHHVMDNSSLCDNICWALRNLSTVPQNLQILKFTSACELLMEILKVHVNESDVMQSAMWCIANLSCSSYLAHYLLAANIIDTMINAYYTGLKVYPDDISLGPVAEASTFAIYNLSTSLAPVEPPPEVKSASRSRSGAQGEDEANGIKPESEETSPEEATFHAECLLAKEKIGNAGACWLLAEYLGRYSKREAMVEAICRAVGHLVDGCVANKTLCTQLHIIRHLCDSMQYHVEAADTTYIIWNCLYTILKKETNDVNNTTHELLVEELNVHANIRKMIVDLIRKHKDYEEILTYGCQLLLKCRIYSDDRLAEMLAGGYFSKDANDEYTIIIKDEHFADFAAAWDLDRISPEEPSTDSAATEGSKQEE